MKFLKSIQTDERFSVVDSTSESSHAELVDLASPYAPALTLTNYVQTASSFTSSVTDATHPDKTDPVYATLPVSPIASDLHRFLPGVHMLVTQGAASEKVAAIDATTTQPVESTATEAGTPSSADAGIVASVAPAMADTVSVHATASVVASNAGVDTVTPPTLSGATDKPAASESEGATQDTHAPDTTLDLQYVEVDDKDAIEQMKHFLESERKMWSEESVVAVDPVPFDIKTEGTESHAVETATKSSPSDAVIDPYVPQEIVKSMEAHSDGSAERFIESEGKTWFEKPVVAVDPVPFDIKTEGTESHAVETATKSSPSDAVIDPYVPQEIVKFMEAHSDGSAERFLESERKMWSEESVVAVDPVPFGIKTEGTESHAVETATDSSSSDAASAGTAKTLDPVSITKVADGSGSENQADSTVDVSDILPPPQVADGADRQENHSMFSVKAPESGKVSAAVVETVATATTEPTGGIHAWNAAHWIATPIDDQRFDQPVESEFVRNAQLPVFVMPSHSIEGIEVLEASQAPLTHVVVSTIPVHDTMATVPMMFFSTEPYAVL